MRCKGLGALGLSAIVVGLLPGVALAAWMGHGSGTGFVKAESMPTGATPSVSVTGRNVAVSWTAATFGCAAAASG